MTAVLLPSTAPLATAPQATNAQPPARSGRSATSSTVPVPGGVVRADSRSYASQGARSLDDARAALPHGSNSSGNIARAFSAVVQSRRCPAAITGAVQADLGDVPGHPRRAGRAGGDDFTVHAGVRLTYVPMTAKSTTARTRG